MLRQEEDSNRGCSLQGEHAYKQNEEDGLTGRKKVWPRHRKGQRKAPQPRPTRNPTIQGLRAPFDRRSRQVRQRRHPRPSYWWWTHISNLRHPSSYLQVHCRLLPEVRR